MARTRRGPGGGLVVTEPTVDAVIDAVVLYLYRAEARLDELFEARLVLEDIATGLAPARLEEQDLATLRVFAEEAQPPRRPTRVPCTAWWPRSAATRPSSCSSTC